MFSIIPYTHMKRLKPLLADNAKVAERPHEDLRVLLSIAANNLFGQGTKRITKAKPSFNYRDVL